jgi:predicted NAD/FAD-dependent oxidoreductase
LNVPAVSVLPAPAWRDAHWDLSRDEELAHMAAALTQRLGARSAARSLKRWRYARPAVSLDGPVVSHGGALVIAGDAFAAGEGRVDAAAQQVGVEIAVHVLPTREVAHQEA